MEFEDWTGEEGATAAAAAAAGDRSEDAKGEKSADGRVFIILIWRKGEAD